jgi:Tol biopolymer transport system component
MWSVVVAYPDGTRQTNVTGDTRLLTTALSGLSWSPTGSQLIYTSLEGARSRLYTVGANGGDARAVTDSDHDRDFPSWSPNGEWIAYQLKRSDTTGETALAISHPDGSGERSLLTVESPRVSFAGTQWSVDSQRLAYFRIAGAGPAVGIVDLSGTEVLLSHPDEDAFNPVWSPDASRIAYSTEDDGVVVVDPANPSNRRSIPRGLAGCGITWAPDSSALLGLGDDCTSLYRIPLSDPASARRVPVRSGQITFAAWQRTAP